MSENSESKLIVFPPDEERKKMREEKNEEMAQKALSQGVDADTTPRVFQAIAEQAREITKDRPFRFPRGRKVNIRRTSGEIQDDWEIESSNSTLGWVKTVRPSEGVNKKTSWREVYELNPDFQVGDVVSVKRNSGQVENGWKIFRFGFEEKESGEKIPLVYVEKSVEDETPLEKIVPLDKLRELNQ